MPLKPISKRATVSSIKKRKPRRKISAKRKSPKASYRYGKH